MRADKKKINFFKIDFRIAKLLKSKQLFKID